LSNVKYYLHNVKQNVLLIEKSTDVILEGLGIAVKCSLAIFSEFARCERIFAFITRIYLHITSFLELGGLPKYFENKDLNESAILLNSFSLLIRRFVVKHL